MTAKHPDATLSRAIITTVKQKGGKDPQATITIAAPLDQEFFDIAAFLAACVDANSLIELHINVTIATPRPLLPQSPLQDWGRQHAKVARKNSEGKEDEA